MPGENRNGRPGADGPIVTSLVGLVVASVSFQ